MACLSIFNSTLIRSFNSSRASLQSPFFNYVGNSCCEVPLPACLPAEQPLHQQVCSSALLSAPSHLPVYFRRPPLSIPGLHSAVARHSRRVGGGGGRRATRAPPPRIPGLWARVSSGDGRVTGPALLGLYSLLAYFLWLMFGAGSHRCCHLALSLWLLYGAGICGLL
jgi:hypothetical protein